jgi:CBS domain-containing membrane protein
MDLRQRRVSEIMRREVVTITAREKLDLTQDIMNLGRVRHLPVLDDDERLVGIVSHRDLLAAAMTQVLDFDSRSRRTFLRSIEVGEVMAKDVVTVTPETPLSETARILVERKIGCVPVVAANGALVGLVTESDLIAAAYLDGGVRREDSEYENEFGSESGRVSDVSEKVDFKGWVKRELDELRRMRDELRVQAHLGKAEMHGRWEALERTFETLESKAKRTSRAAEQPIRQIEQDLRKLAADLREGYRQIRGAI